MGGKLGTILQLLLILISIASIIFGICECIKGELINGLMAFSLVPFSLWFLLIILRDRD